MPLDLVGLREETEVVPTLWICKKLKELRCTSRRVCGLKQEHSLTPEAMCSARDISCPVISEHRPRNKDHPQH